MFALNKCLVRACCNQAVSAFGEDGSISDEKNYCLDHIPDPGRSQQNIYDYIKSHDTIIGLNAPGMTFSGIDLSNKRFFGCNFMHCTFINVHSEGLISRMSMFDFAVFTDCNLIKCNMQFSSFAGSTFTHTIFTGSTLFQINFNGINSFQSSFDDSDLYNSRFIMAKLVDTSFRNCNLKRTVFHSIEHKNILFKMSNTRDADFDAAGKAQFLNIPAQPAKEIEGTGA
ncbi:MAG: pentapeptide repeat-containing protein [Treponemataceae bacterium]|nr:pentapeptide repeat-containing protein [Treponemataceae bacterium]